MKSTLVFIFIFVFSICVEAKISLFSCSKVNVVEQGQEMYLRLYVNESFDQMQVEAFDYQNGGRILFSFAETSAVSFNLDRSFIFLKWQSLDLEAQASMVYVGRYMWGLHLSLKGKSADLSDINGLDLTCMEENPQILNQFK